MHFFMRHAQAFFHELISFANQLHIAVFNAVVHHFYKVPGALVAHPVAARFARRRFRCNGLKNRFHKFPSGNIAARHDGRAMARTFFSARNTCADKTNAFFRQLNATAVGVRIIGIAAVNQDIALVQIRHNLFDKFVHGAACTNHHHDFSRFLKFIYQLLQTVGTDNLCPFGRAV